MAYTLILFMHLLSTAIMFGVIWFVQIIHYPLFALVEEKNFASYEKEHVRLTSFLIMPAMLLELCTAVVLIFFASAHELPYFWLNLILLTGIWLSTFFLQVPLHTKLSRIKTEPEIRKLVKTNWIRTVLWTLRFILLFWVLTFSA
ncbi:hypothetical protein HZR84_05240 [Hyphobacterium sp. CCMP332]|nr:hypothetical protein HZR84_05240 [Hyphobacterium sp. CCMP332]